MVHVVQVISRLAEKYFFILIALSALLGLLQADWQQSLLPYIKPMLGLIIFSMALTLKFEDFRDVFTRPGVLATGVGAQYLIMPLLAFIIAKLLGLESEFAIGLILVGSCPGGTVSNVMVYICRADLPLSVTMTFVSTLLAPLMLPLMMWVYASHWIEVDTWALFWAATQIVLIPLLLGLLVTGLLRRLKAPRNDDATSNILDSIVSLIAIILVCIIIMTIVSVNIDRLNVVENLSQHLVKILVAIFLHNALGYTLGYHLPRIFKLGQDQLKAISIEVGIQNSGLASVLATVYFGPLAVIPAVFSATWHAFTGSALANYWYNKQKI